MKSCFFFFAWPCSGTRSPGDSLSSRPSGAGGCLFKPLLFMHFTLTAVVFGAGLRLWWLGFWRQRGGGPEDPRGPGPAAVLQEDLERPVGGGGGEGDGHHGDGHHAVHAHLPDQLRAVQYVQLTNVLTVPMWFTFSGAFSASPTGYCCYACQAFAPGISLGCFQWDQEIF